MMQEQISKENQSEQEPSHRRVKSFVLRQGRMTNAQELALKTLWPVWGLGTPLGEATTPKQTLSPLNFQEIFANTYPIIVEIGFGMGDSLVKMAKNNPETNYIGIEVHTPGVGHLLQRIGEEKLTNIRVFHTDAIDIFKYQISPATLAAVYLYFPDPWQKRRHNKRRIVKSDFIHLIYSRLKVGGFFHMATDWKDYAVHMLREMQETIAISQKEENQDSLNFINQSSSNDYIKRPEWRPETKFEKKGLQKGHGIWDLLFVKEND